MTWGLALALLGAGAAGGLAGTAWMRRWALRRQLLDLPNARSSHTRPTPRGGGVAIVASFILGASLWAWLSPDPAALRLWIAIVPPGLAVAVIGFRDDLAPVPPRIRLLVHLGAAVWLVWRLGGLPPVTVGGVASDWGPVGHLLAVVAVVWILNLYNFMDGIDGIAGVQAVFVAVAGAWLGGAAGPASVPLLLLAGASAGFLLLNWPPARIFMGDAGSGFLGFALAGLLLAQHAHTPASIWVPVILLAVFLADATVTLTRRLMRGESPHAAHREHAYQRLSRRFGAHRPVTLGVCAVNLGWLLPIAVVATRHPDWGLALALAAVAPLLIGAVLVGAGQAEKSDSSPEDSGRGPSDSRPAA